MQRCPKITYNKPHEDEINNEHTAQCNVSLGRKDDQPRSNDDYPNVADKNMTQQSF